MSLVQPPAQGGPPKAQDSVWVDFACIQGGRLSATSLGSLCQHLVTLTGEKVFPELQREAPALQFVSMASGPATGKSRLCPFHQIFMYIDEIPLNFLCSRLDSPSSPSPFSWKMLQSLLHPCGPSLDSLQYVHVSPVLGSPALGTVCP